MTDENDLPEDDDLPEDMVREHFLRVCAWVRKRNQSLPGVQWLDEDDVAGDVVAAALQVWRKKSPADRPPRAKWTQWLSAITTRKTYEALRARTKHEKIVQMAQANPIPPPAYAGDPADHVASRDFLGNVYKCISNLEEPDKSILLMVWSGRSVAEAATELGLTRAGAGMRLTRIKKFLRREGGFAAPSDALAALREAIERGKDD